MRAVGVEKALALVAAMDGVEVVIARGSEESQPVARRVIGKQGRRGGHCRCLPVIRQIAGDDDQRNATADDVVEERRQRTVALIENSRRFHRVGKRADGGKRCPMAALTIGDVVEMRIGDDGDAGHGCFYPILRSARGASQPQSS
jgi:hypothetical protein